MSVGPSVKTSDHLGFLDGIRGIAALWVLLSHCMMWGGWQGIPLPSPKIAVDIFMVASGFLMVYQYRRRDAHEPMDSWMTAARFWVRRFFRIAPVYYLSLILVFAFWGAYSQGLTTLQQASPEHWAASPEYNPANYHVDWLNTLVHGTFLFGLFPKYAASNMSTDWSIGLEMQFYAVFPVLFALLRRFPWPGVLVGSVAMSELCNRVFAGLPGALPGTQGLFSEPTFLLLKLPVFLIGMLVGEAFYQRGQAPRSAVLMSAASMVVSLRYSAWLSVAVGVILWLSWSGVAEQEGRSSRISRGLNGLLSNRWTAMMADTSYSVYLLHSFFLAFAGGYLYLRPEVAALSAPLRTGILTAIVVPVSYLTAFGLHRWVEKPGIELGRRILTCRTFAPSAIGLFAAPGAAATLTAIPAMQTFASGEDRRRVRRRRVASATPPGAVTAAETLHGPGRS